MRGYYDPLLGLIEGGVRERFIREPHRDIVVSETDPERLLERMAAWSAPQVAKWLGREEV